MSQNLMLALAEEHKQRTGHDIWREGPLDTTHMTCGVCLYLYTERRAMEDAERKYWEEQEKEAKEAMG